MNDEEYVISQEDLDSRLAQTPADRQSDSLTAAERRDICNSCEHKTTKFGVDACGLCGCIIFFKAAFKFSDCPAGKWLPPEDPNPPAVPIQQNPPEPLISSTVEISSPPPLGHPTNSKPPPFLPIY